MSPKPHVPMSNPKGVYRWVSKNLLCVQMSQICVRRWGTWPVCTDESNLCAQMSPLPTSSACLESQASILIGYQWLMLCVKPILGIRDVPKAIQLAPWRLTVDAIRYDLMV